MSADAITMISHGFAGLVMDWKGMRRNAMIFFSGGAIGGF